MRESRMRNASILGITVLALSLSNRAVAAGPKADTTQAFDRIKKLAGTWTMAVPTGAAAGQEILVGSEVTYSLSGAGSVVVETMFAGQPHEMTTVYHMDGDDLVLTHYCSLGNQPRMKRVASPDPNTIAFAFAGGANIAPAKSMHMHEARITIVDDDHLRAEWTLWNEGHKTEGKSFELTRKK